MQMIERTPLWRVLPVSEISAYSSDPFSGYRHRPNAEGYWLKENRAPIRISSLGLRDRERPYAPGDAPRTVVVGDSIIEALQVEQPKTAVAIAETIVSTRTPGAEVVNLGLAGSTPPVEVARLQTLGSDLKPALAVVFVSMTEFLSPVVTDDSMFTAYRADDSGEMRLSYRFRSTRGYEFRNSTSGTMFYWLLDRSAAARILNSRKNIGLFAELMQAQQAPAVASQAPLHCDDVPYNNALMLWRDNEPSVPGAVLTAFIRDLAQTQSERKFPVIIAARGIPFGCPATPENRRRLANVMEARLGASNIQMVDFEGIIVDRLGRDEMRKLHGFETTLGRGHLNYRGNRIYGEVLAETIGTALVSHPLRRAQH
ncbi:MAG: hypothetical protein K2Y27_30605 [Xanthobacteraceae bacterium]|nr:hypothetical protein [Xanthobacteraceae bacterium]